MPASDDWPTNALLRRVGIRLPIVQAPMAGAGGSALAIAVARAGGLGSLPCAMLDRDGIRSEVDAFRRSVEAPLNLNFFCHRPAAPDPVRERRWRDELAAIYTEFDVMPPASAAGPGRAPFDEERCNLVEELRPEIVSFHFGLPAPALVERVKAVGSVVMSSATTVAEAEWLETRGCDVIVAQGYEAGGHRGMFLSDDLATQVGTLALVPQVLDAVSVPVIAAGGVADGRGLAAVLALGANGAQIGTAYLFTPQALISGLHREALLRAALTPTALTNVFSGRPARSLVNRAVRELGPMSPAVPAFPAAGAALAPLKARAEAGGSADFSSLWSGQAAALGDPIEAYDLTVQIARDARRRLRRLIQ